MKRSIAISILCGIFLISLIPSIYRTIRLVSDARGLVIIATLGSKEWTFNPYSKDALFLSPEGAVWILENLEYPFRKCSELSNVIGACEVSLVSWVGRTLNNKNQDSQARGYELLNYFIKKGEPLNSKADGLTPIHEAILSTNARYLDVLLHAGADPLIKSDMNREKFGGVTAYEFLALLNLKHSNDLDEIHKILDKHRLSLNGKQFSIPAPAGLQQP